MRGFSFDRSYRLFTVGVRWHECGGVLPDPKCGHDEKPKEKALQSILAQNDHNAVAPLHSQVCFVENDPREPSYGPQKKIRGALPGERFITEEKSICAK